MSHISLASQLLPRLPRRHSQLAPVIRLPPPVLVTPPVDEVPPMLDFPPTIVVAPLADEVPPVLDVPPVVAVSLVDEVPPILDVPPTFVVPPSLPPAATLLRSTAVMRLQPREPARRLPRIRVVPNLRFMLQNLSLANANFSGPSRWLPKSTLLGRKGPEFLLPYYHGSSSASFMGTLFGQRQWSES